MKQRSPWAWIPSLYFIEGVPYVIVMTVSVILYKRLGLNNTEIAVYTSWLYLPWVIKPFWSPLVEIVRTKRFWIVIMQLLVGAGLAGVAFTIPAQNYVQYTLAFFWFEAFSSATHDIAADGFYILELDEGKQSFFNGIRSTFYRLAMIAGQGLIVILAGSLETYTGLPERSLVVRATANLGAMHYPSIVPEHAGIEGELGIVLYHNELNIFLNDTTSHFADSLINFAKTQNISNRFCKKEEEKAVEKTWLQKKLDEIFADYIKKKNPKSEFKGHRVPCVGLTYLFLSSSPKGKMVVDLIAEEENTGIKLVEGAKFTFDETNWNKPAFIVFQNDINLDAPTKVRYRIKTSNVPVAWQITFGILTALLVFSFVYHSKFLPFPNKDKTSTTPPSQVISEFWVTFSSFFKKEKIWVVITFLLVYRLGESQLVKISTPFLLDNRTEGGLGLSTTNIGFIYGTMGVLAMTLGGILGGIVVSKDGLKRWLWWMLVAINVPNTVYVVMAYFQPQSIPFITSMVALEQFGYGFGFTAYIVYLIRVARGESETAHYAFGTGLMALGMMVPGMFSGYLQQLFGYTNFFVWVVISTIPSFVLAYFIPLETDFGKKNK